mgnify:CR=1 FL=1
MSSSSPDTSARSRRQQYNNNLFSLSTTITPIARVPPNPTKKTHTQETRGEEKENTHEMNKKEQNHPLPDAGAQVSMSIRVLGHRRPPRYPLRVPRGVAARPGPGPVRKLLPRPRPEPGGRIVPLTTPLIVIVAVIIPLLLLLLSSRVVVSRNRYVIILIIVIAVK